jgi:hypothetical protein
MAHRFDPEIRFPLARKCLHVMLCIAILAGVGSVFGKPLLFEGFVETAPDVFPAPVTHVLRSEPGGRIALALVNASNRLHDRPLERVRILGTLASERTIEQVPAVLVEEVLPATWSSPSADLSPIAAGNWRGSGSSLYPSIPEEPLPQPEFQVVSHPPVRFDPAHLVYRDGMFRFKLSGPNGWQCIIDASTDLVTWTPMATNRISEGEITFEERVPPSSAFRFYRARLQP